MNQESLKQIKKLWAAFAAYYQVNLSDIQIQMYAEDCEEFGPEAIGIAMKAWRSNPKHSRLPLPGQLLETIQGGSARSNANVTATRLIAAVKRYDSGWQRYAQPGYYKHGSFHADLMAELGEEAWAVVQMHGGWSDFCDSYWNQSANETSFKAQLRDLLEGVHEKSRMGSLLQLPERRRSQQIESKPGPNPQQLAILRKEAEEKGLTDVLAEIDRLTKTEGA